MPKISRFAMSSCFQVAAHCARQAVKIFTKMSLARSGRIAGREIIDLIVSILLHPGTRGRERCQ